MKRPPLTEIWDALASRIADKTAIGIASLSAHEKSTIRTASIFVTFLVSRYVSTETRQALMAQMVSLSADPDTQSSEAIALQSSNTDTSNGVFRIAMECAYAPFNWTQTTDANGAVPISGKDNLYASGYDVQVAKYIAAELGMSLEVYSYEWDSLIAAVQSGAVDAIIAGMSPTAEREEQVDFTDCYYNSNLVVIIKK